MTLFLLLSACSFFNNNEEMDAEPTDDTAYEAPVDTGDGFSWDDPQDEGSDQMPDDTDTDVEVIIDQDGDGAPAETDCDDGNATVFPGAEETCNGLDDDCDGTVDEDAMDVTTWYADADGDGWGDSATSSEACDAPEGAVADATDCDDTDGTINPGASEVNDLVDNDCDGSVDGVLDYCCRDADGDGWGDPDDCMYEETGVCEDGYVPGDGDCDDTNPTVNPDREDSEFDPNDANCDGA